MLNDLPDLKYANGGIAVGRRLDAGNGFTATGTTTLPAGTTLGGVSLDNLNGPQAGDQGFLGWAYDPAFASTGQVLTAGTLYLSAVRLRRPGTISKVWWGQSTAAVSVTAGQNFAALINSSGTVLSSVGIDSQIAGANGPQSATLAAPQNNVAAGTYWVAILTNAGTPPTLARTNGLLTGLNNANTSGATLRFAVNGTSLTALPGSVTPGSNAVGPSLWVAVN